jgi:hypothetical protein
MRSLRVFFLRLTSSASLANFFATSLSLSFKNVSHDSAALGVKKVNIYCLSSKKLE